MKFQEPADGEQVVSGWMKDLNDEIQSVFRSLNENLV